MENYFLFVLGYDLLQQRLDEIDIQPLACDVAYDFCKRVYTDFKTQDEPTPDGPSEYDRLNAFVSSRTEEYFEKTLQRFEDIIKYKI